MSYHLDRSTGPTLPTVPLNSQPVLRTYALSDIEVARRENDAIVKLVIAVVVVLAILAVLYWLYQQSKGDELTPNRAEPPRRRASRSSTKEMARALYKRLENRGGVSETTMRSLQQLGRR